MKELTIGVFDARKDAEQAIDRLHREVGVESDEISYVYRSEEGRVREVRASDVSRTPGEGAKTGAMVGGGIGALAGIAVAAGVLPVLGPLFAAGPLAAALGFTGAVGSAATGAVGGALAGGLVGALVNLGVGEEHAEQYAEHVQAGNILVATHSDDPHAAAQMMSECGARDVNVYTLAV